MRKKDITILLVDDEPDILEIVSYNLSSEGFQVITADNGADAVKLAKKQKPQLIILDVMMPGMDGIETCEQIRKLSGNEDMIITFLTARSEDFSQMAGLDAGADDYITKPIKPKVLISKVKSLLRRFRDLESSSTIIHVGDLTIDSEEYKVIREKEEIFLPKKEFELLYLLASKAGKILKRGEILEKVWGNEVTVGGRTIDVHIRKLRQKFGDDKFQTVKGVGYKMVE